MLVTSPGLEGSRTVLESLASLENALTYCSATVSEAAASPFCDHRGIKSEIKDLWEGGQRSGPQEDNIQVTIRELM
jgi:hypothetical protein